MIHGSITALITPFRNGKVDDDALVALVERQIAAGIHALAPCGTTGEASTLSHEEHKNVVEMTIRTARGRVPVIAGAGSNATAEAIELMAHAKAAGADAALVVTPYYNKPSQEGIFAHFKALNDAVALPIIVYNIPGRSVVDIRPETMGRIAKLENVIGLKDSTGEPARTVQHRDLCGPDFLCLAGDDCLALGFAAYGARGCVSVVSNVAPEKVAAMQNALLAEDFAAARVLNQELAPLQAALFVEPNPAPAKYALSLLGLCTPELRLPLVAPGEAAKAQVRSAMAAAGLGV
jgi:4-hydroxy-tetrahydrodipicolinate synthase